MKNDIEHIKEIIDNNSRNVISIDKIVTQMNLSKSNILNLIRKHFPQEYIISNGYIFKRAIKVESSKIIAEENLKNAMQRDEIALHTMNASLHYFAMLKRGDSGYNEMLKEVAQRSYDIADVMIKQSKIS